MNKPLKFEKIGQASCQFKVKKGTYDYSVLTNIETIYDFDNGTLIDNVVVPPSGTTSTYNFTYKKIIYDVEDISKNKTIDVSEDTVIDLPVINKEEKILMPIRLEGEMLDERKITHTLNGNKENQITITIDRNVGDFREGYIYYGSQQEFVQAFTQGGVRNRLTFVVSNSLITEIGKTYGTVAIVGEGTNQLTCQKSGSVSYWTNRAPGTYNYNLSASASETYFDKGTIPTQWSFEPDGKTYVYTCKYGNNLASVNKNDSVSIDNEDVTVEIVMETQFIPKLLSWRKKSDPNNIIASVNVELVGENNVITIVTNSNTSTTEYDGEIELFDEDIPDEPIIVVPIIQPPHETSSWVFNLNDERIIQNKQTNWGSVTIGSTTLPLTYTSNGLAQCKFNGLRKDIEYTYSAETIFNPIYSFNSGTLTEENVVYTSGLEWTETYSLIKNGGTKSTTATSLITTTPINLTGEGDKPLQLTINENTLPDWINVMKGNNNFTFNVSSASTFPLSREYSISMLNLETNEIVFTKNIKQIAHLIELTVVNTSTNQTYEKYSDTDTVLTTNLIDKFRNEVIDETQATSTFVKVQSIRTYNGVTEIGNNVEQYDTALSSITIADTVTKVGDYAFHGCNKLLSVRISKGITEIGKRAFRRNSFTTIDVDSENTVYHLDGNCCMKDSEVVFGCKTSQIPMSATTIGDSAFYFCSGLVDDLISGHTNLTRIEDDAFAYTSPTEIVMPNSVTDMGDQAFWGCYKLSAVTLSTQVKRIGRQTFASCYELTGITIPASVTEIDSVAFIQDRSLENNVVDPNNPNYYSETNCIITRDTKHIVAGFGTESSTRKIPTDIVQINDSAFEGRTNMTTITIPDSVSGIRYGAFRGCENLTTINITNNNTEYKTIKDPTSGQDVCVTKNGNILVIGCKNGFIPDGVTTIPSHVYGYYTQITDITIPSSVNNIGQQSFFQCTKLGEITALPTNAPTIDDTTFQDVKRNGNLKYPKDSNYSSWMKNDSYYLGYANWTSQEI